ncbi:hypothetical protein [Streptomyces sp. NPDC017095]|uniref:hypothetical protein n=1 Tax=Streptomyces sp. NPDC017095 TaxID=3364977 RepID=UPI0037BC81F0
MQDTTEPEPGTEVRARALAPTLTVLAVSLAIAAVGVYELCGFGLHSLDRRPHLFSDGLATGGVIAATVAAGAAAGNLAWLLMTARRGAAGAIGGDGRGDVRPAAGRYGGSGGNGA